MSDILNGKKILIQGAGRGNLGLIKIAKEHGVKTIVTGLGGDYPCNPYTDKFCMANIMDCEAVLKVAQEEQVDGAIICCSDTGLKAIGRCNDVMHMAGLTEDSADVSSNKYLMKERLMAHGVSTARFFHVHNEEELLKAVYELKFPVIIKATDLQGSRGICIVKEETKLISSFKEVMSMTRKDACIVEEFIVGREYGAQSFVYDGKVLFVLPHGDNTIMCKTAVPIGHYMPYEMSEELRVDTEKQVVNSIKALGLNNCAVNVDLIERDGKAYIIELTGRVGANCLPELTSNYFGINYYDMILHTVLGESPMGIYNQRRSPRATKAEMIRYNKSGIVKQIDVPDMPDTDILMFVHEGSEVREFTNCNDAIGQIVVVADTLEECDNMIQKAIDSIKVVLD